MPRLWASIEQKFKSPNWIDFWLLSNFSMQLTMTCSAALQIVSAMTSETDSKRDWSCDFKWPGAHRHILIWPKSLLIVRGGWGQMITKYETTWISSEIRQVLNTMHTLVFCNQLNNDNFTGSFSAKCLWEGLQSSRKSGCQFWTLLLDWVYILPAWMNLLVLLVKFVYKICDGSLKRDKE